MGERCQSGGDRLVIAHSERSMLCAAMRGEQGCQRVFSQYHILWYFLFLPVGFLCVGHVEAIVFHTTLIELVNRLSVRRLPIVRVAQLRVDALVSGTAKQDAEVVARAGTAVVVDGTGRGKLEWSRAIFIIYIVGRLDLV